MCLRLIPSEMHYLHQPGACMRVRHPNGAGISSSYDERYPPELEGWMAREEWLECMGRINRRAS